MKQKGIYPYDHMDSFDKFHEKKLPKQENFYSILNDENISYDQYNLVAIHKIKETLTLNRPTYVGM